jgi:hypothetical protein
MGGAVSVVDLYVIFRFIISNREVCSVTMQRKISSLYVLGVTDERIYHRTVNWVPGKPWLHEYVKWERANS